MVIWGTFQAAFNTCHSACHEGKRFWKVCFWEDAKAALARSYRSIQRRAQITPEWCPSASWEGFTDGGGWPWKDDSSIAVQGSTRKLWNQLGSAASPGLTLNISRWAYIWAAFSSWARGRPGEIWEEQEAPKWRKLDRKFPSTAVASSSKKRALPRPAFSVLWSAKIVSTFPF